MFKYNLYQKVKYILGSIGYVSPKFGGLKSAFIFGLLCMLKPQARRN